MDHDYDTIQAHIRHAKLLRSQALGELLATAGNGLARLLANLAHRAASKVTAVATRSAELGLHH